MAVVIIEPASAGIALVDAAYRMGKRVIVLSGAHGEQAARDASARCGASLVEIDTNDPDRVRRAVTDLAGRTPIEAVIPGMEYYVESAADAAGILGLPGITPRVARRMRDKYEMRRCLAEAGLPTPRFALLDASPARIEAAVLHTGLPAIVKPVDGCGSLGVRRVDDLAELRAVMTRMSGADLADMGRHVGRRWMLESYIAGPEYSLEGIVAEGRPRVLALTRKIVGAEPYFVELGHVVGERLAPPVRDAITGHGGEAVAALGLPLGAFHAEVRHSPDGPVLIEAGARLGGDNIHRLVELAHGVSLPELMVRAHCQGAPPDSQLRVERRRLAGIRFFTGAEVGDGPDDAEFDALSRAPGVQEVHLDRSRPATAAAPPTDFRSRVAHVICAGESTEELESRLAHAGDVLARRDAATIREPESEPV